MRQILLARWAFALLAFAVFGAGVSPAAAQAWPARPVTMVVPFPPGGGTDVLGRIIAKRLSEVLGQQVVIENVGGAGGMLGSAKVVKSTPDGYTMVIGTTADAINQTLYKAPLYNFATDLVPAGLMGSQPTVLLARKDFPANTLQEFATYVQVQPEDGAIWFGGSRLDRPPVLRTAQCGAWHRHGHPCAVSRRRPGDAGPDRRPLRLHLHAQSDRQAADRGQLRQGHRHSATEALARTAEPAEHGRAGPARFRRQHLVRPVLPEGIRRSRSSAGSMRRLRRPSTRRGCTIGSRTSSRTWPRATSARPNI